MRRLHAEQEAEQDEDDDADDGDGRILPLEIGLRAFCDRAPEISCIRAEPASAAIRLLDGDHAIDDRQQPARYDEPE